MKELSCNALTGVLNDDMQKTRITNEESKTIVRRGFGNMPLR